MIYHIMVKPNSHKGPLVEESDSGLTVYLRAKAIDGAANAELVQVLAQYFGVAKTRVVIKRGANSRHKIVNVS